MSRIIRLTESQLHNLIVEALLESEEDTGGINWDLIDDARDLYFEMKALKEKHDENWWKKDDGSEDYQRYSELWNEYCNLVWAAQEALLNEYKEYGSTRVKSWGKALKPQPAAWRVKEDERFLYDYLLYLEDYKEMGNTNPFIKYLVFTEMGRNNAWVHQGRIKVYAKYKVKSKEWDVNNYEPKKDSKVQHLGDNFNCNDSRKRGTQHSLTRQTTKSQDANNAAYRERYRITDENGNAVTIDSRDKRFRKGEARDYIINRFGKDYNNGHGYPSTR